MPARRRLYPGRAPAAGISGTQAAYDPCRVCGHARHKHLTEPELRDAGAACSGIVYGAPGEYLPPRPCECLGFTESEE